MCELLLGARATLSVCERISLAFASLHLLVVVTIIGAIAYIFSKKNIYIGGRLSYDEAKKKEEYHDRALSRAQ